MKIMLVEDNEAIIMGLEYLLSQEGYQVVTARGIAQAVEILAKEECGLALLDIALPDGDGFELCRRIKREGRTPVIFLTAKAGHRGGRLCHQTIPQPGTGFAHQRGAAQERERESGISLQEYRFEYGDRQGDALWGRAGAY